MQVRLLMFSLKPIEYADRTLQNELRAADVADRQVHHHHTAKESFDQGIQRRKTIEIDEEYDCQTNRETKWQEVMINRKCVAASTVPLLLSTSMATIRL